MKFFSSTLWRCFLLTLLAFSCTQKKDPSPNKEEISCKLIESENITYTGSTRYKRTTYYTYNSSDQVIQSIDVYSSLGSPTTSITSNLEYDNDGNITRISYSSNRYTLYEYSNGAISKTIEYFNSTVSGYTLFSKNGNEFSMESYSPSNVKNYTQKFTISGSNFTNYSYYSYQSDGKISSVGHANLTSFDDKLSPEYILNFKLPGNYVGYLNISKNNLVSANTVNYFFNNSGLVSQTFTSTSFNSYIYNNSGAVTRKVEKKFSGNSGNVVSDTTYYKYTNCN